MNLLVKMLVLPLLVVILLSACSSVSKEQLPRKSDKEIETRVDTYLRNKSFNGSILMARDGDVWISRDYGMANFEQKIENAPDTRFRIGSLTKQFTAVSILKLQEQGLIHVDDTLDKYISDYPNGNKITIHNLLSQTSGIPEYLQFMNLSSRSQQAKSPTELIDIFKQQPLLFAPGATFNYSNSNYILLGYIIEQASNQSYEEYLNDTILMPLHMEDSGYATNDYDPNIHATGYEGTATTHNPPSYDIDMSVPYAAGAIYSTVEDLYLWDQALHSIELLSEQSLKSMYTPHIRSPDRYSKLRIWLAHLQRTPEVSRT